MFLISFWWAQTHLPWHLQPWSNMGFVTSVNQHMSFWVSLAQWYFRDRCDQAVPQGQLANLLRSCSDPSSSVFGIAHETAGWTSRWKKLWSNGSSQKLSPAAQPDQTHTGIPQAKCFWTSICLSVICGPVSILISFTFREPNVFDFGFSELQVQIKISICLRPIAWRCHAQAKGRWPAFSGARPCARHWFNRFPGWIWVRTCYLEKMEKVDH